MIGRAIIRDLFERERAAAMIGLVTTAMVVAPMVVAADRRPARTGFGWEAIFVFIALLSSLRVRLGVIVLPETQPAGAAPASGVLLKELARASPRTASSTATC